jgi:hypothetical protein
MLKSLDHAVSGSKTDAGSRFFDPQIDRVVHSRGYFHGDRNYAIKPRTNDLTG